MCKKIFSIKKFKLLLFLKNYNDRIYMINKKLEGVSYVEFGII